MLTVQSKPKKLNLKDVYMISCGVNHSMALVNTNNKKVIYSWGSGWDGKLGHGNKDNVYNPKKIETKYDINYISCGSNHSGAISSDNRLLVWGPFKNLGIQSLENELDVNSASIKSEYLVPTLHKEFLHKPVKSIFLGEKYNAVIGQNNREITYWGDFDVNFQKKMMKRGKQDNRNNDVFIESILCDVRFFKTKNQFESICISRNHSVGICKKGKLYSWGVDCNTGRLGLGYEYFNKDKDDDLEERVFSNQRTGSYIKTIDEYVEEPVPINYLNNIFSKKIPEYAIQKKGVTSVCSSVKNLSTPKNEPKNLNKKGISTFEFATAIRKASNISFNNRIDTRFGSKGNMRHNNERKSTLLLPKDNRAFINAFERDKDRKMITSKKSLSRSSLDASMEFSPEEEKIDFYSQICDKKILKENDGNNYFDRNTFDLKNIISRIENYKVSFILNDKEFKKKTIATILKRISSPPFKTDFNKQKIKKNLFEQKFLPFYINKKLYKFLFTCLQLHPCYFFNIYKNKLVDNQTLFNIIKETFGDLEFDRRKSRIFISLSNMILHYDLNKAMEDNQDYHFKDPNNLYVLLAVHLFKSSLKNLLILKKFQELIVNIFDSKITNTDKSKFIQKFALVFRDSDKFFKPNEHIPLANKRNFFENNCKMVGFIYDEILSDFNKIKPKIKNPMKKLLRYALIELKKFSYNENRNDQRYREKILCL